MLQKTITDPTKLLMQKIDLWKILKVAIKNFVSNLIPKGTMPKPVRDKIKIEINRFFRKIFNQVSEQSDKYGKLIAVAFGAGTIIYLAIKHSDKLFKAINKSKNIKGDIFTSILNSTVDIFKKMSGYNGQTQSNNQLPQIVQTPAAQLPQVIQTSTNNRQILHVKFRILLARVTNNNINDVTEMSEKIADLGISKSNLSKKTYLTAAEMKDKMEKRNTKIQLYSDKLHMLNPNAFFNHTYVNFDPTDTGNPQHPYRI